MNDDLSDLETELRALQPLTPSFALERDIAYALEADSLPEPALPVPWWQQLGFYRPLAAFTWGLATPAAAVCAVLLLHVATAPTPQPAAGGGHLAATTPLTVAEPASGYETAATSNVVYQTNDEGVVYNDQQQPERQVRYRSEETLAWRNPHTGSQVEVSYPREEVVQTPISLR